MRERALKRVYRFRSMERLLKDDSQELRNRVVYLSSEEQLNDPLEGSVGEFYAGGVSHWEAFFQEYLSYIAEALKRVQPEISLKDAASLYQDFTQLCDWMQVECQLALHTTDARLAGVPKPYAAKCITKYHMIGLLLYLEPLMLRAIYGGSHRPSSQEEERLWKQVERLPHDPSTILQYAYPQDVLFGSYSKEDALRETSRDWPLLEALLTVWFGIQDSCARYAFYQLPERFLQRYHDQRFQRYRIASFSTEDGVIHSPYMWGVYGNSFRGACLCYELPEDDQHRLRMQFDEYRAPLPLEPVRYEAGETFWPDYAYRVQGIEDGSTMQEESRELFLRKLTAWQEEHEYRLLLPADEVKEAYDCKLHYDFHALRRIYIGRNVSINDILGLREALEAVCKEQHHTVDVYQILGFQGTVSFATQAIQQKLFTVQARE